MTNSRLVTDPELLKQLDEQANAQNDSNLVTDPDLLAELDKLSGLDSRDSKKEDRKKAFRDQVTHKSYPEKAANWIAKNIIAGKIEGTANIIKSATKDPRANLMSDVIGDKLLGPFSQQIKGSDTYKKGKKSLKELGDDPYTPLGTERSDSMLDASYYPQTFGKYFLGGAVGDGMKAGEAGVATAKAGSKLLGKYAPTLEKEISNFLSKGKSKVERFLGKTKSGASRADILGESLINAGNRAGSGVGMEINADDPSMEGAINNSLMAMIIPPVITKGFKTVGKVGKKALNWSKTGRLREEEKLAGESKQKEIGSNAGKQSEYIKEEDRKVSKVEEDKHSDKIRNASYDHDQKIEELERKKESDQKALIASEEERSAESERNIQEKTDKAVEGISHGNKTAEQNEGDIGEHIKGKYDAAKKKASSFFDYIFDQTDREAAHSKTNGQIYKPYTPLTSTEVEEGRAVKDSVKDMNFGKVGDKFVNNPTPRNAHNVRQEVGKRTAELEENYREKKTPEDRLEISKLKNLYEKLTEDIERYLEHRVPNKNLNLMNDWKVGNQLYKDEVAHFHGHKKLREILTPTKPQKGRLSGTKDIHQIFENMDHGNIERGGESTKGDMRKVFDELDKSTQDKILFNQMQNPVNESIKDIAKTVKESKQRYSKLVPKTLESEIAKILEEQQSSLNIGKARKTDIARNEESHKGKIKDAEANKKAHLEVLNEKKTADLKKLSAQTKEHIAKLEETSKKQQGKAQEKTDAKIKSLKRRGLIIKGAIAAGVAGAVSAGYSKKDSKLVKAITNLIT